MSKGEAERQIQFFLMQIILSNYLNFGFQKISSSNQQAIETQCKPGQSAEPSAHVQNADL